MGRTNRRSISIDRSVSAHIGVAWDAMSGASGLTPSDLDAMGDEDKREMMEMVETMQTRDSLRMYNGLVERCFRECVDNFRRKTLDANEEKCVSKCTEKFLKHSARVSMRFAVSGRPKAKANARVRGRGERRG